MNASGDKLYSATDAASPGELAGSSPIALTSPLIAYSAATVVSIAVWFGIFKLVFG